MLAFRFFLIVSLFIFPIFYSHAQSVDLLWQGEVYTPPFYQGKALWAKQSRVTLVAMPQGLGNPTSLNYRWTKNGTVLGNINGVGRNSLSFVDSILSRAQTIEVDIVSGQNIVASASVFINPVAPALNVYENNPLYGFMFHQEVGDAYSIKDQEVTLSMFPLFVTAMSHSDGVLSYQWKTNSKNSDNDSSATYRIPEGASGSSKISASFSNKNEITQRSGKNFLIQFGNP